MCENDAFCDHEKPVSSIFITTAFIQNVPFVVYENVLTFHLGNINS